jgi:hypothetical protein
VTATTKVYRVATFDAMIRHWHFATKREAVVFSRRWQRENDPDREFGKPEIDVLIVPLNATGVANAMNGFIDLICANEG